MEKGVTAVKRKINNNREWLQTNGERIRARALRNIENDLQEGGINVFPTVAARLSQLATFFGITGQLAVIEGDTARWDMIDKAVIYHYWSTRLRAKTFSKTAFLRKITSVLNLTNYFSLTACLLCYGAAYHLEDLESFAFDLLMGMATVPGAVDEPFLGERVFEPFILKIHLLASGITTSDNLANRALGPYSGVIENWDDVIAMKSLLFQLCDYHCKNMDDRDSDWDPEFKHSPFDLVPVEIMALINIRKRIGLTTPTVDHLLMKTPLANPRKGQWQEDETILKVRDLYQEWWDVNRLIKDG